MSRPAQLVIAQVNMNKQLEAMREVRAYLANERFDVVAAQEPNYNYAKEKFALPTQIEKIYHHDHQSILSAAIFARKGVVHLSHLELCNSFVNVAEINFNKTKLILINAYFNPSLKPECEINFLAKLNEIIHKFKNRPLLVVGDFNAHSRTWGCPRTNPRGRLVEELISDNLLTILNDEKQGPTFDVSNRSSFVDLTLCNFFLSNEFEIVWKLHPNLVSSDHKLIEITLRKTVDSSSDEAYPKFASLNEDFPEWMSEFDAVKLIDYNEMRGVDIDGFKKDITKLQLPSLRNLTPELINNTVTLIINDITKIMYKNSRKPKNHLKGLYDLPDDVNRLRIESLKARRTEKRRPTEQNCRASQEAHTEYRKGLRNFYFEKWKTFVEQNEKNIFGLQYKVAANKVRERPPVRTVRTEDGNFTETRLETDTVTLNTFFREDDQEADSENQAEIRTRVQRPYDAENDPKITIEELTNIAKKLGKRKAPGIDSLKTELVKAVLDIKGAYFTNLFNKLLFLGVFPSIFKIAILRTIPKINKPTAIKHYRPICLLSILGKIFEKCIYHRVLSKLLNANPKFGANQFGFSPQKSCENALNAAINYTNEKVNSRLKTAWLSIDYEAAFDTAWWPLILDRLRGHCIGRNTFLTIQSYLSDRWICMIREDNSFLFKRTEKGCPQGSVLGPIFWNVILDEWLNTHSEDTKKIGFADDCLAIVSARSLDKLKAGIERVLREAHKWSVENKLRINFNKTKIMFMRTNAKHDWGIDVEGGRVETVEKLKYLGIVIDRKFLFKDHLTHIIKKIHCKYPIVTALGNTQWGYSSKSFIFLYKAIIEPVITYGSSVTWPIATKKNYISSLERAVKPFVVKATKSWKTAALLELYTLANITPAHFKILERALIYHTLYPSEITQKILQMDLFKGRPHLNLKIEPRADPKIILNIQNLTTKITFRPIDPNNFCWTQNEVYLFTDGSSGNSSAGAAFIVYFNQQITFNKKFKLNLNCTPLQTELFAIFKGLTYCKSQYKRNINIITDSQSSLQHICNPHSTNKFSQNIRQIIINSPLTITLYHTKSHNNFQPNELADRLAKSASRSSVRVAYSLVCKDVVKELIGSRSLENRARLLQTNFPHQSKLFIGNFQNFLSNFTPDKFLLNSKLTQIITGKGNLNSYRHKIGKTESPNCQKCSSNEYETSSHLIFRCDKYASQRQLMISKLEAPWPVETTLLLTEKFFPIFKEFLNSIDL